MKKLPLLLSLLLTFVFSIGQLWATEESVTLSSGSFVTDHIEWSAANGNITITQLKGSSSTAVNSSYVSAPRVYKGHVLSFSAAGAYKINKIEITCNGTYYGNSMTAGTAISENVVTDNTTDVGRTWTSTSGGTHVISAVDDAGLSAIYIQNVASEANTQLRFTALKITYTAASNADDVTDAQLAWSAASAEVTIDAQDNEFPTLTNTLSLGVTYQSTNTSVATIDENGSISLVAAGETTIKAVFSGNASYNSKTVSYDLTVNAAPLPEGVKVSSLVFSAKCDGAGTADDDVAWTVTSDGTESVYDATSGIHYGTGSANVTYMQLATAGISGTVTKVIVNARDAQAKATVSVTVGGVAFACTGSASATNSSADYTFTGSGKGEIIVRIDRGSSMTKAIYCKSVIVYYEESGDQPGGGDEEETVYTVAGSPADVFGTAWAPELTDNEMTKQENGTYKWEKANVEFNKTSLVQFKVVEGHAWGKEYPNDNYSLNINEAGVYTITINFNPSTKEVSASATKTGEAQGGDDEDEIYTVAGSHADVFGTAWDPSLTDNEMTKQEDGTYKWEKADVELDTTDPIEFKVVVGHAWGEEYPTQNYKLAISEAGIYTIAITFNPSTKEVAAAATKAGGDQPGGGDQPDDEEVTDKVVMKGFAGIETTGYQNQTKTGASENGIEMVAYAFNGATGQVRGNKTTIAGASVTTDDNTKNWSLYNSQAMPGAIKKIEVTHGATGTNVFKNNLYVSLGNSSQGDVTTVDDAQVQDGTTDGSKFTFTIDAAQGYNYFKLLTNDNFTAGTVADVQVLITYVQNSGDQPGGGDEEETVYSVAGSAALLGTNWGETEGNEMTRQEDGTYKLVIENIELAHGNYEYKVVIDHKWNNGEAGSNSVLTIDKSGKYNVTFTYKPATEDAEAETSAEAKLLEELVIVPTVQLAGINDGTWDTPEDMTIADDKLSAYIKVNLTMGGTFAFKVIVASTWLGENHYFLRDDNTLSGIDENIQDMYFYADAAGEYTFTWTYADNSLTITYPEASTCADVYAMEKSTEVKLNDVEINYVNGKNVYVKDASGSMLLYLDKAVTWEAGCKLSNVQGTVDIYNGLHEVKMTESQMNATQISSVLYVPAPEKLETVTTGDLNKYILLRGVTAEGTFTSGSVTNINMKVGDETVVLRNNFKLAYTFEAGKKYDVTGVVSYYNSNVQVYFISAEEAVEPLADGYYLLGSFNNWTPAAAYLFTASSDTDGEYVLNATLTENESLKVAKVENESAVTWYPDGSNNDYQVSADVAGARTIYFRPEGNTAWEAFHEGGYFYIDATAVAEINTCAAAAAAALTVSEDNELYNNGATYTIQGYVTFIQNAWANGIMTFWIADTKEEDKVLEAYKCAIADQNDAVRLGDLVKVTGQLTRYMSTPEFAAGCTCEIVERAPEVEVNNCATARIAALSVSANNELYNNGATYTIQGYVTTVVTNYAETNNWMTFWMADSINGGQVLEAYRVVPESADRVPAAGDIVKVTGNLTKYNATPEFAAGCTCVIVEQAAPAVNLGEKTIAEFLELKNFKDTCILTGVVSNIKMDGSTPNKFGNFDLEDNTGKVYIYGLLTAEGVAQQFNSMGIEVGDTLTVKALYYENNGKPEASNAIYVSHKKGIAPVNLGEMTIAAFLALKNEKDTCILTGVVANVKMDESDSTLPNKYGNFDLVEIGNPDVSVYIYGLLTADGQAQQFQNMNIAEGDTLTLKGVYHDYGSTIEIISAIYVSHKKVASRPRDIWIDVEYATAVYNVADATWTFDLYKAWDSDNQIVTYPELYVVVKAKSETAIATTYTYPDDITSITIYTAADTIISATASSELKIQYADGKYYYDIFFIGDDGNSYILEVTAEETWGFRVENDDYTELTLTDGITFYYLVGDFCNWVPSDDYRFAANAYTAGEYKLNATLAEGNRLKVLAVQGFRNTWYPDNADDYLVDSEHAGEKTVYFRPEGNPEWEAFHTGGFFYIGERIQPAVIYITIKDSLNFIDNTQALGWWQIYGHDDTYGISIFNKDSVSQAPGTYDLSEIDLNYTYLEVMETGSKIYFVNGQGQVVLRQEGKTTIVEAALKDADDNIYNIYLEYTATATGLDTIGSEHASKFIENGRLVIERNGVRYDVTGQPIR